jgi:hypothetical protein
MVFCPHLIVDDIVHEDTGLIDYEGNRIVKVHEWGFHQDNQEAEPWIDTSDRKTLLDS